MKIVVLDKIEISEDQKNRLAALGNVVFFDSSSNEECKNRVRDADVVVVDWIDPGSFLGFMKSPSLLALMSTGYGWVDIKKARNLGVSVCNVPDYATEAVAEHSIGLMFGVARKLAIGDSNIRSGNKEKGYLKGVELAGRKAGIIGLGNIGRRVAQIAAGIGMEVFGYDIIHKNIPGIKNVGIEELLKKSDVVFVACSLNGQSNNLLDEVKLKSMKKDAILISTTWGVVDLGAITNVLKSNLIYGAGFDVSIEGGVIDLPREFTGLDNVLLTPHVGYNTREAKIRQVDICISNIENYLAGSFSNIVN